MKIRHSRIIGILLLVFGGVDTCLVLGFVMLGARLSFANIFIVLAILLGVLFLTRPYFVVKEGALEVRALIGPASAAVNFTKPQDLSVEKFKVYLTVASDRQELPIFGWLADRKDWKAFVRWTETGELPPEPEKKKK